MRVVFLLPTRLLIRLAISQYFPGPVGDKHVRVGDKSAGEVQVGREAASSTWKVS